MEKSSMVKASEQSGQETPESLETQVLPAYQTNDWTRFIPGPSPLYRFHGLSPRASRIGVVSCGCACLMLSGVNVALMGSVSSVPSYLARVGLTGTSKHTQLLIGLINAIYWVGVIIGALLVGPFSDRVGRRRAISTAGLYAFVVIPLLAGLQSFGWALALRFLNGLATGAFDSVGLNWAAESTDARTRGRAIGFQLCCAALGASQSYFLVYGIGKARPGSELVWRFPIAYQCVFVLFVSVSVYFLPESPRWLVRVGLVDSARDVLQAMGGGDRNDDVSDDVSDAVEMAIGHIQAALDEERAAGASTSYASMFFGRDEFQTARRTWSALFVQFATQALVGVGFVSGYGIKIFEAGGWSSDLSAVLAGCAIVVQAVFGLPGALLADRMGRRPAFVYGALVGCVLLAFIGMCGFYVARYSADGNAARTQQYSSAVVALMMIWCAQFGVTWLWAPFAYPSELFPARVRAQGSSVGIVGLALGSFFVNMISPYLFAAIAYRAMFLFSGLSLLVTIVSYLFLPETAKKTLEEIDHIYDKAD